MTAHSQLTEPILPQRRRDPVRRVLARLNERRRRDLERRRQRPVPRRQRTSLRRRMQKRKAALALSAGVAGLSAAAIGAVTSEPARAAAKIETPLVRLPARDLRVSDSLKEALIQEEGVRDVVYRDVAGYPTVGVGHLVSPAEGLRVGDRISYDRVLDLLEGDLAEAEAAIVRIVGDLPLFQHEFDALVDLVFNVGEGNLSPLESPRLREAIAARDYATIADELDYRYAGGQLARGLAYRSARRAQIFLNAAYDNPRGGGSGVQIAAR